MTSLVERLKALASGNREFDLDVRQTYFALRMGAGGIGAVLPIALVTWGLLHDIAWRDMTSLSAFYWLSLREPIDANALLRGLFVGSLVGVGVCLIIYRGYGYLENRLLDLAGLAAIVVAFNPMPWPGLHADPWHVHYTAAIIYAGFALAMVAAPALAFALAGRQRTIFVEAFGVWVFSAYWFVKTYELSKVSCVEPRKGPMPKIRRSGGKLEILRPQPA